MQNPEFHSTLPRPEPRPFKNWSEAKKALTKLSNPAPEAEAAALLADIEASPQKLQIAFQFLSWSRDPKFSSRLDWLAPSMVTILGGGDPEPDLESVQVASEAKTWVFREFQEVRNVGDWSRFVASGRHLWVLSAILKACENKQVFVEALTALAECAEHCQNTDSSGKRKRTLVAAEAPKWIANSLKAKIPAKLTLPKTFLEALFAINSTAHLGEELRCEANGLQFRLKNTLDELSSERTSRQGLEQELENTKQQLAETLADLAGTQEELREEKLHSTRLGGFNTLARNETIQQVMAKVRQGVMHRLSNITGFADRPNPNGQLIVELVQEIQNHLSGIEEAMKE